MKLFTWVILTCYIVLFILLGVGLIGFALHWFPVEQAAEWLKLAYTEKNFRISCFIVGVGLVLLNAVYADLALARFQRQKIIAFDRPDGRVTLSLRAIEDYVRRSLSELPEVKELRPDVVARQGKILIRARAVLWSGAHIPEAAERIQSVVKGKVQEMLTGIEEPVCVRVHVAEIARREKREDLSGRRPAPYAPPFRGY